jgi:putative ABC transport system permease protein
MILWRAGYRNMLRHPWLTVLATVGVALGVAVVTAVDLANGAALRSFEAAAQAVAGKATHQVVAGPAGVPEEFYRRIRVGERFRGCAPVVTGNLQVKLGRGMTLQLVGVDPFAEPPVRAFSSRFGDPAVLADFLVTPGAVLLLDETAAGLGLRRGDHFRVEVAGRLRELSLAGTLVGDDELTRLGLASVAVTDIASAQELLGEVGRLSRIDLVIPPGAAGAKILSGLSAILPPGTSIIPAGSRAGALERMTRSLRLNLTALSLLALMVGMFLIYNTMTFYVVRRRRLIGMLRALGVSRREIFAMICAEALLIGCAGTALGLFCGELLGLELTGLVTRTINDLYFAVEIPRVPVLPGALVKGAVLGVAATLAAAFPAALEATGAPPRAVMSRSQIEARHRRLVPVAAAAGLLLLAAGASLLLAENGGIPGGFTGLFAIIVGYALLVPGAVVLIAGGLRPLLGRLFGVIGKMAARGVVVSLSRTGVATAALVVAVAAGIGVGIMVGGFRMTVQSWLESWLQADVYVRSADNSGGRYHPPLDPALVARLSALSGAGSFTLSRRVAVTGAGGESTEVLAVELPRSTFVRYRFKKGDPGRAWPSFKTGASVVVSEPYSYRHHLAPGDSVTLRTVRGERSFPVSAIIYDYGSDMGIVMMSRRAYLESFNDAAVDGMTFYARPGVAPSQLAAEIRSRGGESRLSVILNRELKCATVAIFDRTFAITGLLRILIMVVAFVGILSALMAMQVERARELAVLRALGLTPGQVWGVVCGETALIGIIAGLLSLPLGILEALILVYVINLRSFGWTMQFSIDPLNLVQALLLSLCAALLAGIYPSLAIARTSPALALKEEE